ncbi:uncharacterized protein K02A2.6-like [Culex pipiens pallens]|uniref:uncharacterized protein K02A2.6-like n=1 Tax=Culex pipiens pallens TaxID=42434 RepID=UPI001953509C|nr:uncharacterized protein K02A2.6-like [Culex pipiens pallens]XP_039443105.1 uncharacterized protein K02A2.6-like [Culex pipiens pallens]
MEEKVDMKIKQMLESDIIEPAVGPPEWISPMVVVPKGNDDIRLCINMKYPNEAIQREHYPLPMIDTLLNKLRGSTWFSKLDITSAFHHVELHPDSRGITTFMTSMGLMRFKRLTFGINAAPEMFQRIMCGMLAGIEGVIVYIDDIVVFGVTKEEHDGRLEEVMAVLRENNATLNKQKCLIGVRQLDILGYNVSAAGISPSEEKIASIRNFREPESKEEVRSFLGLVNFVGQFIPHLSTRSEPLRQFVRGDTDVFGDSQRKAFDDLRNELSSTVRRLGFFDPKDDIELYVDASPVGLGAVLTQRNQDNTPRIVSFASKGLTKAERVYPQTQREALAVVWAVEKFYSYLFGTFFTIYTDHKTLEYIYGGKHRDGKRACTRAEGWALRLQPYRFRMDHIPGSSNISDILSRLCPPSDEPFDEESEHYLCAVSDEITAITLSDIRDATTKDETLLAVMEAIKSQNWPSMLFQYQAFSKELGILDGIVVRDDRIVLPASLRPKALDIAHRGHPGIVSMRRRLRENVWWPYMDRDIGDRIEECAGCAAVSVQGPPEPMCRKEMPDRAWQDIAIDFFSAKDCCTFLVIVDYYSRFLKVIEMNGTTAGKTIEALQTVFDEQSYPETIRCDNGPPFSSEEFAQYCLRKNIRLVRTIPYWPQMNGLVERLNQGILRSMRIARATSISWRTAVKDYVHMYNTTPHTMTGKAPLELLTGRPVKDLLPSLRTEPYWNRDENVRDDDAIKKMKGKLYADNRRHAKTSEIAEGDTVLLRNYEKGKLEPNFNLEKFKVVSRNGTDTIVVNGDGVTYRRPVAHLKKWVEPTQTGRMQAEENPPESAATEKSRLPSREHTPTIDDSGSSRPKRARKLPARFS